MTYLIMLGIISKLAIIIMPCGAFPMMRKFEISTPISKELITTVDF
jgi:hypothetical protein